MIMFNLKATKIYELPFKADKEPVQFTAGQNLFLLYCKKNNFIFSVHATSELTIVENKAIS